MNDQGDTLLNNSCHIYSSFFCFEYVCKILSTQNTHLFVFCQLLFPRRPQAHADIHPIIAAQAF